MISQKDATASWIINIDTRPGSAEIMMLRFGHHVTAREQDRWFDSASV